MSLYCFTCGKTDHLQFMCPTQQHMDEQDRLQRERSAQNQPPPSNNEWDFFGTKAANEQARQRELEQEQWANQQREAARAAAAAEAAKQEAARIDKLSKIIEKTIRGEKLQNSELDFYNAQLLSNSKEVEGIIYKKRCEFIDQKIKGQIPLSEEEQLFQNQRIAHRQAQQEAFGKGFKIVAIASGAGLLALAAAGSLKDNSRQAPSNNYRPPAAPTDITYHTPKDGQIFLYSSSRDVLGVIGQGSCIPIRQNARQSGTMTQVEIKVGPNGSPVRGDIQTHLLKPITHGISIESCRATYAPYVEQPRQRQSMIVTETSTLHWRNDNQSPYTHFRIAPNSCVVVEGASSGNRTPVRAFPLQPSSIGERPGFIDNSALRAGPTLAWNEACTATFVPVTPQAPANASQPAPQQRVQPASQPANAQPRAYEIINAAPFYRTADAATPDNTVQLERRSCVIVPGPAVNGRMPVRIVPEGRPQDAFSGYIPERNSAMQLGLASQFSTCTAKLASTANAQPAPAATPPRPQPEFSIAARFYLVHGDVRLRAQPDVNSAIRGIVRNDSCVTEFSPDAATGTRPLSNGFVRVSADGAPGQPTLSGWIHTGALRQAPVNMTRAACVAYIQR